MSEHPTPWRVVHNSWETSTIYDANGEAVAQCPISSKATCFTQDDFETLKEKDADLIVAAVNEREKLVRALAAALPQLGYLRSIVGGESGPNYPLGLEPLLESIRALLERGKGE